MLELFRPFMVNVVQLHASGAAPCAFAFITAVAPMPVLIVILTAMIALQPAIQLIMLIRSFLMLDIRNSHIRRIAAQTGIGSCIAICPMQLV